MWLWVDNWYKTDSLFDDIWDHREWQFPTPIQILKNFSKMSFRSVKTWYFGQKELKITYTIPAKYFAHMFLDLQSPIFQFSRESRSSIFPIFLHLLNILNCFLEKWIVLKGPIGWYIHWLRSYPSHSCQNSQNRPKMINILKIRQNRPFLLQNLQFSCIFRDLRVYIHRSTVLGKSGMNRDHLGAYIQGFIRIYTIGSKLLKNTLLLTVYFQNQK